MPKAITKSQISANTLFHYTKTIKNLISILENDFYPSYCLEEGLDVILGVKDLEFGIPMVSFCEIPLSLIENHVNTYGSYAIGLSKEWGIRNKISPIMYSYSGSSSAENIYDIWNKGVGKLKTYDTVKLLYFLKPYKGALWKNGKKIRSNVPFYNEREWRYVPNLKPLAKGPVHKNQFINKGQYLNEEERNSLNKYFENDYVKLKFEPKDIKYLIIKKESQRRRIKNRIKKINTKKYNNYDIEELTTRILSMEQIMEDF